MFTMHSVDEFASLIPEALQQSRTLSVLVADLEGKYVYVNEAHRQRCRFALDEFYGADVLITIHPDDHEKCRVAVRQCLSDPTEPVRVILRKPERAGSYSVSDWEFSVVNDSNGAPIGILCIGQDMTEAEANARRLKCFYEKLASVLSHMQQGFIEVDADGTIVQCNAACETILGLRSMELGGRKLPEFVHPEDAESLTVKISGVVNGLSHCTMDVRTSDAKCWLKMEFHPAPEGAHVFVSDITETRLTEQHQQELLQLTLGQNERLRSFAHIVSHNLRSHANNIGTLLTMLADEHPELRSNRSFEMLGSSSERLLETVGNLSTVARMTSSSETDNEPVNLLEKIDHALSVVAADLECINARPEVDVPPDWSVIGVSSYIESVFLNLITNAVKYRHPERPLRLHVSGRENDRFFLVSVTDNGLGIDLSRHESKLFGMYNTFHQHPDAQGIGLFIAKNQMEAMGGYIAVESVPDQGSMFTVGFRKTKVD